MARQLNIINSMRLEVEDAILRGLKFIESKVIGTLARRTSEENVANGRRNGECRQGARDKRGFPPDSHEPSACQHGCGEALLRARFAQ
ncbi:hypothetical protein DBV15_02709, partial [Temnothorax longispinosus]